MKIKYIYMDKKNRPSKGKITDGFNWIGGCKGLTIKETIEALAEIGYEDELIFEFNIYEERQKKTYMKRVNAICDAFGLVWTRLIPKNERMYTISAITL